MKVPLRILARVLLGVGVTAAVAWGAPVLWFTLPLADAPRGALALLFAALGLGGLLMALVRRRILAPLAPFALACALVLVWWSTIEPSNERA